MDISFEKRFELIECYLECNGIITLLSSATIIRKKYLYLEEITFHAKFKSDNRSDIYNLLRRSRGDSLLKGILWDKRRVCASFQYTEITMNEFSGRITELEIGQDLFDELPTYQYISVYLSDTNLALPENSNLNFHYSGEIKSLHGEEIESNCFTFDTKVGVATLVKHYSFESNDSYNNDSDVDMRISRVTINIPVEKTKINKDTKEIFKATKESLDPIEYVLSYLSRRQVRWHEIVLISEINTGDRHVHESCVIRQGVSTPQSLFSLITPHNITDHKSLDVLVNSLVSSPFRKEIEHSINYLNAMLRHSTIEARALFSFTAFEALINGISEYSGKQDLLSEVDFNYLRKQVEKTIKLYSLENGIGAKVRGEMYKKVCELNVAPIVSRAVDVITNHNVPYNYVIGSSALEEWLRHAYMQRSLFVHRGDIRDIDDFVLSSDRIHALTECVIYSLVGGDNDWLDTFAYRHTMAYENDI